MRDLLALLVLVVSTTQVACKKTETKEPSGETKAEVTAPSEATDPGEEAQLAMLELVQECYEGGPPVGLLVNVKLNNANELESVTIEPPADEPTTACVVAKVKASDLKAMSQ